MSPDTPDGGPVGERSTALGPLTTFGDEYPTSVVRRFRDVYLGGGGGILIAALLLANVGNFAFHVAVTRLLTPAAYGPLAALLAGLLVVAVPMTALQAAVTGEVAARRQVAGQEIRSIRDAMALWGMFGIIAYAVIVALAPTVRGFLNLSSAFPVLLLGLFVIPALVAVVPRGMLLGERRFRAVAVATVAGVTTRLVAGVAFTAAGLGLEGAVAATVVAETVTCWFLVAAVRPALARPEPGTGPPAGLQLRLAGVMGPVAAFVGFWLLVAMDPVLAQHYFPRATSSAYGAASAAARVALFVPAAVSLVAFPTFAATGGRGSEARRALRRALVVVGLVGAATAGVIGAFPDLAVEVAFGRAYVGPPAVLRLLAVSSAMAGLVGVLLHFHLAARSSAALLGWVGVLFALIAVRIWHGSTQQLATAMALSTTGVFLAMLAAARVRAATVPRPDKAVDVPDPVNLGGAVACPLDLTLVVPYYNPGEALRANLTGLVDALNESGVSYEIIPVADGCSDGSESIVREWPDATVHGVMLASHQGKGAALRVGLSVGSGRYLGFIDGDGDLDPRLLLPFVDLVRDDRPDIVLGSKRHPQSDVVYPPVRRLYSWTYQQLIRALFRLDVRDTQTGLKLIRRDVLATVLPRMVERRFVFDLELFVVARQLGYRNFVEAPVRIRHRFTSTISLVAVLRMLRDTLSVFYRLKVKHAYSRPLLEEIPPHDAMPLPGTVGSPIG